MSTRHPTLLRPLLLLVVVALLAAHATAASTPRADAKITSLPGLAQMPSFDMYSGYVSLPKSTKNIFYWFVESAGNPAEDPVMLWLQGGPGCSDFGDGFLQENGPFRTTIIDASTQQVGLEPAFYSWNKKANMLYIDSPCGVGFSYGSGATDNHNTDNGTAIDSYTFLQAWFDIYSEYKANPFWITGESYGGMYIPTLAYQVLTNTSAPYLATNLKKGGLMLGNPVTGCDGARFGGENNIEFLDTQVNLYYWHGMASRRNYDTWNTNGCNRELPPNITACEQLYKSITAGVGPLDQPLAARTSSGRRHHHHAPRAHGRRSSQRMGLAGVAPQDEPSGVINPDCLYYSYCTGNATLSITEDSVPDCFDLPTQTVAYLNDPAVQSAIHAQPTKWGECGGISYKSDVGSLMPYLDVFFSIAPSMRILYYAGDIDIATVPFASTQRCLETLKRPIKHSWREWVVNKEVAGYVEEYDTYTFATIKAGGHEAPAFQPASSYVLFTSFLSGVELPRN
eukprot:TRINITY_DN10098_c0_g1_i1.p1 TRINITY_DN10098_c0_g1~~TRINITY_DN10098_c0_g1_i1.p1  ORF type:complete len:510 (+),score=147.87 TRINITY_DN10098_c0_g1_i1:63-1592(+)